MAPPNIQPPSDAEGFYKVYEEYSKTLRTWLVAYGIGGPVLLLTNESVSKRMAASGRVKEIALLFLVGVGLQVLLATLNKTVMWACYYGEHEPTFKKKRRYKLASWISEQFWMDFVVDLASLGLFGWVTFCVFRILTSAT